MRPPASKHKKISTSVFEYLGAAQDGVGEDRAHEEVVFLEVKNVGGGDAVKGGDEVVIPAAVFAQGDVFYGAFIYAEAVGEEVNGEGADGPEFCPKTEVGNPNIVEVIAARNKYGNFAR